MAVTSMPSEGELRQAREIILGVAKRLEAHTQRHFQRMGDALCEAVELICVDTERGKIEDIDLTPKDLGSGA